MTVEFGAIAKKPNVGDESERNVDSPCKVSSIVFLVNTSDGSIGITIR